MTYDHFSFGLANLWFIASEKLYLGNCGIVNWVGVWYLPQLVIKEHQLSRLPLNLQPPEPRNLDLIFLHFFAAILPRLVEIHPSEAVMGSVSVGDLKGRNVDPGWRMVDLCLTSIPRQGKSCFAVFWGWISVINRYQQQVKIFLWSLPKREVISDDTLPLRWRGTCQGVQAMLFWKLRRGLENCTSNIIHLSPRENSHRFIFICWSTRAATVSICNSCSCWSLFCLCWLTYEHRFFCECRSLCIRGTPYKVA